MRQALGIDAQKCEHFSSTKDSIHQVRMLGTTSSTFGVDNYFSIWRPLTGQYIDTPLAMCDARTVQRDDLVPADIIFPHYCDEGFEVLNRSSHKWIYKNPMDEDEVILFKLDDSDPSVAKCEL